MKNSQENTSKTTLQTVNRALDLVNYLAGTNDGMSVLELSKLLGITRISTYNLINSLMRQEYVERDEKSGRYFIGYRFLEIGSTYRYRYPFASIAERYMDQLDPRFQVNVSVLKPPARILLLLIKESSAVQRLSPVRAHPAYASAAGKMLLSGLPDEELSEIASHIEFIRYSKNTITDSDALLAELEKVRQQGYAMELDELLPGRGCLACPIRDMSGNMIASISLSGEMGIISNEKSSLLSELSAVADSISVQLGYSRIQMSSF